MHEMSLCQGVIDLIDDQRRSNSFDRVRRVILEIGALGHVDPDALRFAFDVCSHDTVAAGALLEILEIPAKGWCMDCSVSITIAERGAGCPGCGGHTVIMQQGDEMRLKELEVV
jgi:hydrogenase nickel incorporation protein HypA/HybF